MYVAITIIVLAPFLQFAPVHPEVQLHVSGFTHSPPFRHPPVHMAGQGDGAGGRGGVEGVKAYSLGLNYYASNMGRKISSRRHVIIILTGCTSWSCPA